MGTPLVENPQGLTCLNCWGPAGPFGEDQTPEIMRVALLEIQRGNLATDEQWNQLQKPTLLYQSSLQNCLFVAENDILHWLLFWRPADTQLTVGDAPGSGNAYQSVPASPCQIDGTNSILAPAGSLAYVGRHVIEFSEIFT